MISCPAAMLPGDAGPAESHRGGPRLVRRLVLVALGLGSLSCTSAQYPGMDLWRPPVHCATNDTDQRMRIFAEAMFPSEQLGRRPGATVYRVLEVRDRVAPGRRACFRWPWVSRQGRIVTVVGRDTTRGVWFDPWR